MVEPYVYCQNICGPARIRSSAWGRNAWLTGTASWTYVAGTQWILASVRATRGYKSPRDPARVARFPRQASLSWRYLQHHRQARGRWEQRLVVVDGKPVEGDVAPSRVERARSRVKVTLS